MEHLTLDTFRTKVFDDRIQDKVDFKGDLPVLIDFYADWCGPCKMIAPIIEKLGEEFKGKVDIYKVNTEQAQDLASVFGVTSIPSLLFIPKEEELRMAQGAMPEAALRKAIEDILL